MKTQNVVRPTFYYTGNLRKDDLFLRISNL